MYLEYFQLAADPFRLDPNLAFVFVSKSHEETLAHLVYGIEQGEDFVLLTGGVGTGKTLALHYLLDQIGPTYRTAFVNVTQLNFLELLKLILDDFGVPFPASGDRGDLLRLFKNFLREAGARRDRVLIIVDEAQNLDIETLEGLRLLGNLTQPGEQILQIIIVGQPALADLVADKGLVQLNQRIRVRYELEGLGNSEVAPYVEHRVSVAGGPAGVFSRGALERIAEFSGGIPRLVNQYAGKALLAAYVDGSRKVASKHVHEDKSASSSPHGGHGSEVAGGGAPGQVRRAEPNDAGQEGSPSEGGVDASGIRANRASGDAGPVGTGRGINRRAIVPLILVLVLAGWWVLGNRGVVPSIPWPSSVNTDEHGPHGAISSDQGAEVENNVPLVPAQDREQALETAPPGGGAGDSVAGKPEARSAKPVESSADQVPEKVAPETAKAGGANDRGADLKQEKPRVFQPHFFLHIASFRDMKRAEAQVGKLALRGIPARVNEWDSDDSVWYRVYLGPFNERSSARETGNGLKADGTITYFQIVGME